MNTKDDADATGWNIYRVAYSHDRDGWCIFTMINGGSVLHYHSGPYTSEVTAKEKMKVLNEDQGVEIRT